MSVSETSKERADRRLAKHGPEGGTVGLRSKGPEGAQGHKGAQGGAGTRAQRGTKVRSKQKQTPSVDPPGRRGMRSTPGPEGEQRPSVFATQTWAKGARSKGLRSKACLQEKQCFAPLSPVAQVCVLLRNLRPGLRIATQPPPRFAYCYATSAQVCVAKTEARVARNNANLGRKGNERCEAKFARQERFAKQRMSGVAKQRFAKQKQTKRKACEARCVAGCVYTKQGA
jgi:hypothetical protein